MHEEKYGEVEFDPAAIGLEGHHVHPAVQGQGFKHHVLHIENHLEDRAPPRIALQAQFADQFFEGKILVGIAFEGHFPHLLQKFEKGGIAGEVGAQPQGIDEESDHPFELARAPPRDGRPHHEVALARTLGEKDLKGR